MERSTIVEGQTLGTEHIMEGTCSRLRFFVRNMNTDMCIYTYTYTIMYTYIQKIHVQKQVRVRGWEARDNFMWTIFGKQNCR